MIKWRMIPAVALSALLAIPAAALAQEAEEMAAEQVPAEAIQAEIEAMQAAFEAALNGDDPGSAAEFYTEDAFLMPPNMPAIEGIDGIREFFAGGMGGATLDVEVWEVQDLGEGVLLDTGGFEITGAEGEHLDHGKYMSLIARTDDGLKITREIWNSSMAAPEMGHGQMREMHEEMHEKMHGEGDAHEMKEHADMDDDGDAVDDMDENDDM